MTSSRQLLASQEIFFIEELPPVGVDSMDVLEPARLAISGLILVGIFSPEGDGAKASLGGRGGGKES